MSVVEWINQQSTVISPVANTFRKNADAPGLHIVVKLCDPDGHVPDHFIFLKDRVMSGDLRSTA